MDIAGKWFREPSPLYPKVPLSTRCPNDSVVIRGAEIPLFSSLLPLLSIFLTNSSSSSSSFIFFFFRRQSRLGSKQRRREPLRQTSPFFPLLFFFSSTFLDISAVSSGILSQLIPGNSFNCKKKMKRRRMFG